MSELETVKKDLAPAEDVWDVPGIVQVSKERHPVIPGGTMVKVGFLNGYGASVVQGPRGSGLYGSVEGNTWELAATDGFGGDLIDTPITGGSAGVVGWLDLSELAEKLLALASLPPRQELEG